MRIYKNILISLALICSAFAAEPIGPLELLPSTTAGSQGILLSDVVTADIRAFVRTGTRIDVTVAAMGDGKSLQGGILLQTPLMGADGKIYLMNFAGEVVVVNAADGKVTNTVAMGDAGDNETRSTIVAAYGQLLIRTNKKLYCIGQDSGVALAK